MGLVGRAVATGLIAGVLSWGAVGASHAAGLQISPVGLSLKHAQRAGALTLSNVGSAPVTVQVRAFQWTQDERGEDVLTPTQALVVSPPMAKIGAETEQQFRVIRTQPAGVGEEAYRLIIDELPLPETNATKGLQLVLRYSVPVFLNADEYPEPTLQWRLEPLADDPGKTVLTVRNTGPARAQLSAAWLDPREGQVRQVLSQGLLGYVLAGHVLRRTLPASVSSLRSGRLTVVVNGREVHPDTGATTAP
ncbi:MAG: fimbria/pilus periplasmic chaperone [Pseudomonadota bacterium]|nr:fimbria/pilus periplasmic chaperone [Pseudomonadota bacterium]